MFFILKRTAAYFVDVTSENRAKLGFNQSLLRTIIKLLPWEIAHVGVIWPTPLYYMQNPDLRLLTVIGIVLFIIFF